MSSRKAKGEILVPKRADIVEVRLLIPTRGNPDWQFCCSKDTLQEFCTYLHPKAPDGRYLHISPIWVQDGLIPRLRTELVKAALAVGAEWLLWMDDDMVFPPNALHRLLAHKQEIVGATYVTKTVPPVPIALVSEKVRLIITKESNGLAPVIRLGLGLCLMKASLFENLPEPWFDFSWQEQKEIYGGEDVYFWKKMLDSGKKLWCDQDLSYQVGHRGRIEFVHDMVPPMPTKVFGPDGKELVSQNSPSEKAI